ncbi:hypothetical protein OC844_007119 [Tilletia horrida]|nr:hypothetical protein OC844_007119 [Tilletia horrida]
MGSPTGSLPPPGSADGSNSGPFNVQGNPNSGILHTQLSWGPRPALQQQLRSSTDLRQDQQLMGGGAAQHQHAPQAGMPGMYSQSPTNLGVNGMPAPHMQQVPIPSQHPHVHRASISQQGSVGNGANGNGMAGMGIPGPNGALCQTDANANANTNHIFNASWHTVPNAQSARDFALNFSGTTGAWNSQLGHGPAQPSRVGDLPPSGCLVAAAAQHARANSMSEGGRSSSSGNGNTIFPLPQHHHIIPHPAMISPDMPSHLPPTPSGPAPVFGHSHAHMAARHPQQSPHPQTPLTPATGIFPGTEPPHSARSADSAFIEALLSNPTADRRPSIHEAASTMSGSTSMGPSAAGSTAMNHPNLPFGPIAAGADHGMQVPSGMDSWVSASSAPNMPNSSAIGSFMHNTLDPNLFASLGENLTGLPETTNGHLNMPIGSHLLSGAGVGPSPTSNALAPGGLLATTEISGSQLSMTDPFHAVSLELWRQLGYSSSQTYGVMGADGGRGTGGAMILEGDDVMTGLDTAAATDGSAGLGSAISFHGGSGGMNGAIIGGGSVISAGSGSHTADGKAKNGLNGTAGRSTSSKLGAASLAGGDDDEDAEAAEEEDMLGSDDEADEDENDETMDPADKAARLSAKKLRLHRRQGVTCDQCRSKHLRCDLSDRKFKAFEASLQRSLGHKNPAEPAAHARQEAALAVQAEDEAKLDAAAAAKAAASGTPVVLNNPIRCTRCEKRGLVCTKSYNPPSKRHPRPSRTGKRIEQARQLHGSRPLGEGVVAPMTARQLALEDVYNMLAGEGDLSEAQSTDARLYNRILASSINIRLLTTYFAVFHIQMPVIDFDNFCFRFNSANGDARKMAIMANGGDEDEGLPSAVPMHQNVAMSESSDPRDSTVSTPGTVEALMAAMHLCAALYTDMPLVQPLNSKKLFRTTTPGRQIRKLPSRADPLGAETVNSFILPHPKGSKEDQATEHAVEVAAAEAAGKRSNKRLKRKQGVACDSCRLRRVRCDLTERPKGASCTRCEDKKINCTAEYIESIRAKGKTVVLDVVHAKAEEAQKNRARDREVSKGRMAAAAAAAAAAVVGSGGPESSEAAEGSASVAVASSSATANTDAAAVAAAAAAVAAAAAAEDDEEEEEEEGYDSDGERTLERAQERWVRSGAVGQEFGRLRIADESNDGSSSKAIDGVADAGAGADEAGRAASDSNLAQRSTSREVDMGSWGRVSPQVPDTVELVHQKDMLQWGRARQGFFEKLKERAIELVYRHDLLHRPSTEAVQTLMILCHILYAVDPVQVKLFASVALKHIKSLNLQTRHEVYEQDQEAVEHLLTDMQASRVYLTSWTRDGIMSGMYRTEPNFPEERTIQVKGGQRPFDPSDQLKNTSIGTNAVQASQQSSGTKELSGQMGLTFSIMAMTQIGALSRFVAKHIDRTEGVPAGASATDRFPLLPTAGDMKKLTRACNAVWQGTDALLQFFDKCAARSRDDMDRLKPFQPLPWIAMLKMCGAMLDLAVYRVLSERYGVNAAYMAAITRQIQMSNGTTINPKIRPLSEEDFEQAKILRHLFEKGRNRAMIRSRRTAHLAAFLLRKNVFQFGGVIMRQFFAVSQFLARMPCEDSRMANPETRRQIITTLENTPQQSIRGSMSPEHGSRSAAAGTPPATTGTAGAPAAPAAMAPSATSDAAAATTDSAQPGPSKPASVAGSSAGGKKNGNANAASSSGRMDMQVRPSSPSSASTFSRTESNFSGRTVASVEGEGHVPWYVGARELGPFDTAAKRREVGWCLEAMAQIGYAWPDMELKISSGHLPNARDKCPGRGREVRLLPRSALSSPTLDFDPFNLSFLLELCALRYLYSLGLLTFLRGNPLA